MLKNFRHIAITVMAFSACTQKSSVFDSVDVYEFPGLASIKQTGDGTLSLSWENVPVDGAQF